MKKQQHQPQSDYQLTIILVNYNGWGWLRKCLLSFQDLSNWIDDQQGPKSIKVIVVDNGSKQDKSIQFKKKFPWLEWIRSNENLGFAGGNNLGLSQVKTDYAMLLNSDTEFLPNTNLLSLLENFNDQSVGVVTPKVILPSGKVDHACHRGFPTPWNALMYYSGIAKWLPKFKPVAGYRLSYLDLDTKHDIEACSGAAMLVRLSAIKEVGLLDEQFFMYAEDIDWCYRFKEAGWRIIYDPSIEILHHKHKSGQKQSDLTTRRRTIAAFYDTMWQFMQKHYASKYSRLVLLLSFVMIKTLKKVKLQQERN